MARLKKVTAGRAARAGHASAAADAEGPPRSSALLTIRARRGAPLTGQQRIFNRLTKRIATLERKLEAGRQALENLLNRFLVEVAPVEQALARRQLELAHALSAAHARLPLRKRQTHDVRFLILMLCDKAFHVTRPDEAAMALYDEWATSSYREGEQRDHAELKARLTKEFRDEFGFDAEMPDDIDDSPEGFALFRKLMEDRVRRADDASLRGGTRSHNLREAGKAAQRASLRKRSIREIYLALAKVLHPDAVADPEERALREEGMKQAIAAYRDEDLVTLLDLERRWGGQDSDRLRSAGDDVLGVYVATLQERALRLGRELRQQIFDPRFSRIAPVVGLAEGDALAGLKDRAEQLGRKTRRLERLQASVADCRTKNDLARLVGNYLDSEEVMLDVAIATVLRDD